MTIAENLLQVRERIARAAEAAGRLPDDVLLVGVTKYVTVTQAAQLAAAGCSDLGESRPQELWHKAAQFASGEPVPGEVAAAIGSAEVRWHLVGHLQRNKVRRTLPLVSLIHSVDSQRLLAAINDSWEGEAPAEPQGLAPQERRPPVRVLLEVNTSGEAAKHGLASDEVEALLAEAPRFPHVAVCGLMTMAALEGGPEVAARNFAALRDLRDRLRSSAPDCVALDELSMGMSGDFEIAIREGATIVRVGTALWEECQM